MGRKSPGLCLIIVFIAIMDHAHLPIIDVELEVLSLIPGPADVYGVTVTV